MQLHIHSTQIPLKTTFKQASSVRTYGESTFVEVIQNGHTGIGEGCPRMYVTGEDLESAAKWLTEFSPLIEEKCRTFEGLKAFVLEQQKEIDQHPAAWCAVESALLGLFANEKGIRVEALLGIEEASTPYTYTAVLAESSIEKYHKRLQQFLMMGFQDFKVKFSGEIAEDQQKIKLLQTGFLEKHRRLPRIRVDANNFFTDQTERAIAYFQLFDFSFLGIEEALSPKQFDGIATMGQTLGYPMILDESLCYLDDLDEIIREKASVIANLKVSRIGGMIRGMRMIDRLKEENIPIIIGAHVGESSIMTRAGMLLASYAGEALIAQEGAFGEMLLARDPAQPSLMLGAGGKLDIAKFELAESGWGLKTVIP